MKKVSILIPCYNAERWIAPCIESALGQTWSDKEVVVVDDGSSDASLNLIKQFGDAIRWETGPNRGGNVARNRLLELAQGTWLQYLDADDYLLPDKVAEHIACAQANPEVDIVFSPVQMEHVDGDRRRRELLPIVEPHDPWVLLARWFLPQTGAVLWRKDAIVDVQGWKEDQLCCQEHELYLRLLVAGKRFQYCPHSGAVYRQWGEHTTCKRDKPEVRRRRLEIERKAEYFLIEHDMLTAERQWAINQARFEMARIAWHQCRYDAHAIIAEIQRSLPGFVPAGKAAPAHYRFFWRCVGFRAAETIADWRRKLSSIRS